jgi:membrane protease YdiL (CAAX protease family)
MPSFDPIRLIVPALLACLAVWWLERQSARKGLTPPGFAEPWRRALAGAAVAAVLWVGVTAPLSGIGRPAPATDLSGITTPQLFLLHALMVAAMLAWFLLGFAGVRPPRPVPVPVPEPVSDSLGDSLGDPLNDPLPLAAEPMPAPLPEPAPPAASLGRRFAEQFGFAAPDVPREIGLGVLLGVAAWVAVLVGVMAIGLALYALGGDDAIPKAPPALVPWIAALPVVIRLAISLSAGVVEEWFFRGFLQPRVGILLSTALFVLAHFSYGQPFMLIGISILSLIYGLLVRWRQNLWPAIAAHALFDGVQLVLVIPGVLKLMQAAPKTAAALLGFW